MSNKCILLAVADPQTLVDITQTLGAGWEATSVSSEADALAQLEKRSFDALVVDFNLGSPDGSALLNLASEKRPETIRFLLAYEADLALIAAKVLGTHHILPKPIEPASLKSRIENGVAPNDSLFNETAGALATGVSASPMIPPVYSEVLKALDSPDVTNDQVGEIIAQDAALASEVLRLTNSAYLGSPRNLTDPAEAVASLGLDTVKALVMALRFLAEHSRLKPGYLSIEQIWQHSINVALIARDLMLFETKDRARASEALAAGLLHDLGKIVLVTNFDDLYGRVNSLARKQPVALWEVEKEMFGANHGEIGACLVGMWNLPIAIVEAAALHHEPPLGEQQHLTPLAAVHIANVIEHQLRPGDDGLMVAPKINTPFLDELGLMQRLPVWRAAFANRSAASAEQELKSAAPNPPQWIPPVPSTNPPPRTANRRPAPAAATRTATSGQPESGDAMPKVPALGWRQTRWVYACIAAGLLILLALWLGKSELNQNKPVYARTPAPYAAPPVASATPSPEVASAPAPDVKPAIAVSEQASNVSSAAVPKPAISLPAPEPVLATAAPPTATNVPPASLAPKEQAPPDFRLTGIIYTVALPSAIMNGKTVYEGDQVNGATVINIGRTHVTLLINGQRKTYVLR